MKRRPEKKPAGWAPYELLRLEMPRLDEQRLGALIVALIRYVNRAKYRQRNLQILLSITHYIRPRMNDGLA